MGGFLLCFASTASATGLHYLFGWEAPYPWWAPPKLLGVPGGLLLVAGSGGLAWLKTRGEGYEHALEHERVVRVAVDRVHARPDTPLKAAREVALFPPMTGG